MYKIIKDKDNTIQDSVDNVVIDPELKEKLNGVSSLTYSIPFNDENYDNYHELETTVEVYGENESNPEFVGRLLSSKKKFNGNKELTFEGELAYLNDVQYPPFSFSGSPEELFTDILDYYNSKCSPSKKIYKGYVTVTDSNNYITRENQDYSSCWNCLCEKLINTLGGYIKLRYLNGNRYLDYLVDSGNVSNQKIEFGKNLLDLEHYINASTVATVIIPLGAMDESTGNRVDISSVNDGKNYIESTLVEKYGRIEKVVIWDDITLPSNLLTKARKNLGNLILSDNSITTKAIDLHFSSKEIDSFKIGNIINCISKPHNLNVQMTLVERTRKLNDPVNDTITIGNEYKTLTNTISETNTLSKDNESKITGNWLQDIIEKNTKLLLGGAGGYIYVNYADSENKQPDSIYIMDSSSLSEAKNVIVLNKNGIGYSINGIDGPFTSAWTIDGRFNAELIQANSIDVNQLKSNVGKELDLSSNESIKLMVNSIEKEINKLDLSSYQITLMKSGNVLTKTSGMIIMNCSVNHSGDDITESLDASAFNWQRSSADSDSDDVWNNAHKGVKSITVTNDDVTGSASFSCTVDVTSSKTMRTAFETIVDETDVVRLGVYIDSNMPYTQSLGNDGTIYPSWTNTVLTPQVTDAAVQIDNSECTFEWKKRVGDGDDEALGDGEAVTDGVLKITKNVLSEDNPVISYICYVDYRGNNAKQMLTFALALPGSEGKAGQDGQAKYTWIRYADDDKGTNISDSPSGKSYIGIANNKNTDVKSDNPLDYVWSRIQGNSGRGMTGAKAYFALSSSNTVAPSGEYTPERPEVPEGQYLWQKIYFTYDDNTSEFTEAVCVTGVKGNGIKSKDITYQIWNDGVTTPTGEWTSEIPKTTAEMTYMWTRIIFTYDDGTTSTFYSVGSTPAGLEQEINDSIDSAIYELSESFSTSIDELDDSITQKVNRIEELANTNTGDIESISQRITDLTLEDGAVTIMIRQIAEKLGGYYTKEEIKQWMRFDENGELSLGSSDSDFQSVLSKDKLAFKQSKTEVAWISNKQLHIKEAVIEERIIMDPFILEIDENGFVIR